MLLSVDSKTRRTQMAQIICHTGCFFKPAHLLCQSSKGSSVQRSRCSLTPAARPLTRTPASPPELGGGTVLVCVQSPASRPPTDFSHTHLKFGFQSRRYHPILPQKGRVVKIGNGQKENRRYRSGGRGISLMRSCLYRLWRHQQMSWDELEGDLLLWFDRRLFRCTGHIRWRCFAAPT